MVRNTSLAAVILLGGGMLFVASIAFLFLGMPLMERMLTDDQAGPDLSHTMEVIWVFAAIAMMLLGIWGMFISITIRKNLRYMRKQAMSLGVGLMVFGTWGFMNNFPNWKLGFFLLVGLLIFIPGIFLSKKQGPYY